MFIRIFHSRRFRSIVSTTLVLTVAMLVSHGCSPDLGPPPDENAKNTPPAPEKQPNLTPKAAGKGQRVKSIKEKS